MSARWKNSLAILTLCLALMLCVFPDVGKAEEKGGQKGGQEKSTTRGTESPQTVPTEITDEFPVGDMLPDMPEPDSSPSDRSERDAGSRSSVAGPDYLIGPEDVLEVEVFNVPELKRAVRVSNDGMIGLALIGQVKAAGLTVDKLRGLLESRYGETYLQKPQISVFVTDFRSQSVSVVGAVEKPGMYQLWAPRNLIEIISMAGGLAKKSTATAGRTLVITRKGGFGDLQVVEGMRLLADDKLEIEIRKLLYSQDAGLNIAIKPFDTISVSKADLIYVVGDVRKPAGIVMEDRDELTVLQALAMAEGLNRTASKNKAKIFRKSEDGGKIEIPIKLGDILKGKAPDTALAANDILFIPDSTGKIMAQRALDTTIATVSGIIIWRR
ncbi:MAG: polysaccharide biosynthesis/export family protein [Acidobacteria bacterium]|nr:polysaccharide biosynthesis/export family protein [Acidobacteriota bacterium]